MDHTLDTITEKRERGREICQVRYLSTPPGDWGGRVRWEAMWVHMGYPHHQPRRWLYRLDRYELECRKDSE